MFGIICWNLVIRFYPPSSQDPGLLAWPLEQSPTPWLLVCKCLGIRPSHLSSPGQQFKYQYYWLNQSISTARLAEGWNIHWLVNNIHLVVHQLHAVLPFLLGCFSKVFRKTEEGLIISTEVGGLECRDCFYWQGKITFLYLRISVI